MAESVQERWEALKRRLEARRDERLAAHVASYQTAEKAELSARSARGGARGSTKGAPGGASQRGVSSARDAKLQPPPSSSAKPPQPRRRVASAAPPSAPPRPRRRAPEAMEAALGGVAVEGPPRRAGLVTPLSFLFSRVLVGCACFVAGVAYADSLPGERGVRRRALGRARKSVARSASRVVAQAQPLLTDLQRRVRPALAEAVHTAAALPPLLAEVCQALALRLRALFAPRLPPPPPPPRVAASYDAHAETETEPDVDEAQMLRAGARAVAQSLDIAQEVGGPAMLLGHPADDVDSEEQEAEALQRAVQAASARREALDGGHAQLQHHRQSSEQERRARELEARLMEADAAVRADAFAAASAKALSPPRRVPESPSPLRRCCTAWTPPRTARWPCARRWTRMRCERKGRRRWRAWRRTARSSPREPAWRASAAARRRRRRCSRWRR